MQQILQPIDGGATEVVETPIPTCGPHEVLIANRFSLISAGTERSTVELAKTSLLQKARKRPDHVKRVLEKVRQEGLLTTIRQVRAKLATPMPLGYSSAGVVIDVGDAVRNFHVGDCVASNGPHAGVVAVGENLVARVPENLTLDRACYAVVGAVAMQGVRLAKVGLSDVVGVIGLGLIGQMTVSLLKAAGCMVIGADLDPKKQVLAVEMGADFAGDVRSFSEQISLRTGGRGADAILITASTSSNQPIETAAAAARQKGKIVAVGAVGMTIPRREFYPKELDFVVSCSYGPGRYDADYEQGGRDYPYAYVRWTEQRNIEAVMEQMAAGRLPVEKLTTHRFGIEDAPNAYELISSKEPSIGVVLEYPAEAIPQSRRYDLPRTSEAPRKTSGMIGLGVIGAGNFAGATLIPMFAEDGGFQFTGLSSAGGPAARTLAGRHKFAFTATDFHEVLADQNTDAVAIATRHNLHVPMGLAALKAGKHVFLEKPLAINDEQLDEWLEGIEMLGTESPIWMVGFNRRFSPGAAMLRQAFEKVAEPKCVTIRFNAGRIPADHWIHDPEIGGGRIIGEACHAIDLATFLIGAPPGRVQATGAMSNGRPISTEDDVSMVFRHADGSLSTILYTAGGDRASGKERVEMFGGGRSGVLDDFRLVEVSHDGKQIVKKKWWSQQKGYAEEARAFRTALAVGRPPIPYRDLIAVTQASLRAVQSLRLESALDVA
jgi:predicted dehydrogenase/threonine dehydrogenase-like Zn-dependent dehydrogenase